MTALGGFLAGLQKPGLKWTGPVSSVEPLTVRSGGADIPCVQVGQWAPVIGSEVLVENVAGRALAMGYVWPHARPDVVTVTDEEAYTPDADGDPVLLLGHLTAEARGHEYLVRYLPSYTPTVGDQVAVSWGTPSGLVIGVAAPVVGVAPAVDVGQPAAGVGSFRALDAATWLGGWRTDRLDVIQGDWGLGQNNGAWFYGNTIASLSGAHVRSSQGRPTGASLRLNRQRGGAGYSTGEQIHIYRHTATWRGLSDVTRVGAAHVVSVPLGVHVVDLPTALAQDLIDHGGGLSIAGTAYAVTAAIGDDPESGLVTIDWERPGE